MWTIHRNAGLGCLSHTQQC